MLVRFLILIVFTTLLYSSDERQHPYHAMTAAEIVSELSLALDDQGVYVIAQALVGLPSKIVSDVLSTIIRDKSSSLSDEHKIALWLLAAYDQEKGSEAQQAVLNLYSSLGLWKLSDNAAFLIAAHYAEAAELIALLERWIASKQMDDQANEQAQAMALASLKKAVRKEDLKAFKRMLHSNVLDNKADANTLLWLVLDRNKNNKKAITFLSLLIDHGADSNDNRKGYSPLAQAVANNNLPLVKTLIKKGATVELFHDKTVGTPLQIAIENGFAAIDEYLRSQGARE